jgi:hypothetical protein
MRRILHEFRLPPHPDKSAPDAEPALVQVCGPSDSAKSAFPNEIVVILQWRSPFGDDLFLLAPRDVLVESLKAG